MNCCCLLQENFQKNLNDFDFDCSGSSNKKLS